MTLSLLFRFTLSISVGNCLGAALQPKSLEEARHMRADGITTLRGEVIAVQAPESMLEELLKGKQDGG